MAFAAKLANLRASFGRLDSVSSWRAYSRCSCFFHDQTFSRCGNDLKMHSRTFAELNIAMLNTSIGSCQRRRR